MRCPRCGADLTCEVKLSECGESDLEFDALNGEFQSTEEPQGMEDWIVTNTGLEKILMEYAKAKKYMELM